MAERPQPDDNPQNPSRRGFLKGLAAVTAVTLGAGKLQDMSHHAEAAEGQGTPETHASGLKPTFETPELQAIAEQLRLEPAGYFVTSRETVDLINTQNKWLERDKLMPIFAAGVMEHAEVIEKAATEHGVPANFLGIIGTIESNGISESRSPVGALGMFQIMPNYHMPRFVDKGYLPETATFSDFQKARAGETSLHTLDEYLAAFNNPEASARVSAEIFSELIPATRAANPEVPENHPEIYERAAAGYNGGGSQVGKHFWDMPDESMAYYVHVQRFIIDAEVAARAGVAPYSPDVNPLASAFAHIPKDWEHYETVDAAANTVAKLPDLPAGDPERHWYEQYQAGATPQYEATNPAYRIWMAGGERH